LRFYFDWVVDHRLTDFLAAKRDLFLFPPDEAALRRFHDAIRKLVERAAADGALFETDPQRRFFLDRIAQETRPLLDLTLSDDLAARVADVESRPTEIQDLARRYSQ
jgi:hypothetical protein